VSEPEHGSLAWRKSTASDSDGCVEIAVSNESVHVRNARDRGGPTLKFLHNEWAAFLAGVHNGEFELPPPPAVAMGTNASPDRLHRSTS
jgi:Domain of unknown function (DUF397)